MQTNADANLKAIREQLAALQAMYEALPAEEKQARERAYRRVQAASAAYAQDQAQRAKSEGGRPVVRRRRYGGQWR
mgnify:CR=1 FL=1